ncbi:zinc finger and BTB domain-containing protein 42-like [Culex pipiens pallens]|uniref:zinc finger and BTB domain-containing protein 42-like n=1 Tax=Culex pipiens pallens TaxID=42434 RepID=UPI001954ACFF|nr:zinc finger and BTB domain-containing protein 42-like [Culex pipiens pallens]
MEQDEFTLEYFCRLCAAEAALGVMLHPLFPPGDDDPKDELVRMIDVLTSVTLNRTQDSAAVICDKCLQMLDLFCQFREECLRQDVMIRTRRELDKERRQEEAAAAAAASAVCVEIKEEPEQDEPPTIVIDDCKDEPPGEEEEDDDEDDEDRGVQPCANQMAQQLLASSLVTNNSSNNSSSSFMTPAEISLYSQTSSLSISVQVNQISLDNMGTAALVAVPVIAPISDQNQLLPEQPPPTTTGSSTSSSTTFRKGKLDPNKPPPDCELCQESFSTHYDYEQHLDQVHAWDRGTRCSLACDPCQMRFTKSYNLKRHMYEVHGELAPGLTVTACEYCGLKFLRGYTLNRHVAKMHSKRAKAKKMMILKSK